MSATTNTGSRLGGLSASKQALIEKRLRGAFKGSAREQSIPRRSLNSHAPLSFSQQRLWLLEQLQPGSTAYHVPVALRINGGMDPGALEKSLNEVVRRHEILRATFPALGENPVQVISGFEARSLPVTDLREESPVAREERIKSLIGDEAHQPFDLERGPLVRWRLLRLDEQEHVLVVTMHHIVSDGWSLAIFCRELQALYESFSRGATPALPEPPIQYADFSVWQREQMEGPALEGQLTFWKDALAGAPAAVVLPLESNLHSAGFTGVGGHPRFAGETLQGGQQTPGPAAQERLVLPEDFSGALSAFAQREGVSPFITMLAALVVVLSRWTQQSDLVVGTVVAGRNRREIEDLIGCFMNFLPLRTKVTSDATLLEVLGRVKATVLDAYAHQDCPFDKIVEAINPARKPGQNPLYNVAFLMQNFPRGELRGRQFTAKFLPIEAQTALLDLRFLAEETEEGWGLICEYDRGLFESETAHQLLHAFRHSLEMLVRNPRLALAELEFEPGFAAREVATPPKSEQRIAITATFTAEPLEDTLRFWREKLHLPIDVQFAPYNQVFQQLLDPTSLLVCNHQGMNVVLVRWEDWERFGTGTAPAGPSTGQEKLERYVRELAMGLKTAANRSSIPWLVSICPPSKRAASNAAQAACFAEMDSQLAGELSTASGVHLVMPAELWSLYPVADYDEPHGDELGHVPYTPILFAALGTLIMRKFHALKRAPKKVIVLDCDQTLWTGVCGEDGPRGVTVDPTRRALQEFMLAQREAGMLLCLCSKNSEEDVRAVFECCPEMVLRPEHFAASRINWRPKSENLRSLAEELRLGLDSFVLVDDNPLECAEAEANCPEVLAVQVPEEPQSIADFLKHTWVFDHLKLTQEDRNRASLYDQARRREQLQMQSLSLAEFLAGLNLKVGIEEIHPGQVARAAQLTGRTNQFNFTTKRRSESELQQLLRGGQLKVLTVSVSDRFGDYGLVGVMIYESTREAIKVDTFLLSCRVLGKGIEHRMLARLGQIAQGAGRRWVEIQLIPSARNKPALDFLESVGSMFRQGSNGAIEFRFPSEVAATMVFKPERATPSPAEKLQTPAVGPTTSDETRPFELRLNGAQVRWISLHAHEASLILQGLEKKATSSPAASSDYVAPRTELEQQLCRSCEQLLKIKRVGIRDDFFALGGSSLLAVQLLAQVRKISGKNLPLSALFQAPTVEQLATVLEEKPACSSALAALQPNGSKPPLILVHGAGGGILWGYANLAAHLDPDQPVYAIEPQAATAERASVEELASRYINEVRTLQPIGPYYLGGYCFGGYVAYEMARQLVLQGEKVALLALIEATAPNGNYEKVNWLRLGFIPDFARNLSYWLADFFNLEPKAQREFFFRQVGVLKKKLAARLRRGSGKPIHLEQYVNISQMPEHELGFWRLHLRAGAEYVPQPYPGRITLVRTRAQPLLCSYDPAYGWGELAGQGVEIKMVPGSHENIFKDPDVRSLAKPIQACLNAAQTENPL